MSRSRFCVRRDISRHSVSPKGGSAVDSRYPRTPSPVFIIQPARGMIHGRIGSSFLIRLASFPTQSLEQELGGT